VVEIEPYANLTEYRYTRGGKKMKKIGFLILGLGLMLLSTKSASAFSLANNYHGPLEFKFTAFADGALYTSSLGGGTYGNADGDEDAFTIFKVSTFKTPTAQTVWFDGKDGQELTGIFYGLDDDFAKVSPSGSVDIQSVGGHIDLYLDNAQNFDPTGGPGARTGTASYPTVTDGTLFLSLDLKPGIKFGDGNPANDYITYENFLDSTTSPFTGKGGFYADITGGAFASLFNTHSQCVTDDSGNTFCRDFFAKFDTSAPGSFGWLANAEDPVVGASAVPEPATMLLLGSGLLGMAGFRKRKIMG